MIDVCKAIRDGGNSFKIISNHLISRSHRMKFIIKFNGVCSISYIKNGIEKGFSEVGVPPCFDHRIKCVPLFINIRCGGGFS